MTAIEHLLGNYGDATEAFIGWLSQIKLQEGESATVREPEPRAMAEAEKVAPRTPPQTSQPPPNCQQISPTDTLFSCDVTFGTPDTTPFSPCPGFSVHHSLSYAETEASSLDDEEHNDDAKGPDSGHKAAGDVINSSELDTLNSYGPPSDDEQPTQVFHPARGVDEGQKENIEIDTPRLVWITSCLQCILAGLPCSRTPPACSRCKRNNHAPLCLLHRRRNPAEIMDGKGLLNRTPVLLKVAGDDEHLCKEKDQLAEEVCRTLLSRGWSTLIGSSSLSPGCRKRIERTGFCPSTMAGWVTTRHAGLKARGAI